MPKQKRYKNLLKAAAASASLDNSVAAASASSTNPRTSSRTSSMAPTTTSEDSSGARRKGGRESKRYWKVQAIDEYGVETEEHLLAKDVHNLAERLRIIVNFDKYHAAIGEAAGLLAGVCGQLATDCVAFPISFEKWSSIPDSFFENQWNSFFSVRFCFKDSDYFVKHFLLQSLSKKWREYRLKLWNEFHDPRLSKTELIKNVPADIVADQWALYVQYRLKPETQNLCRRNQEIRQKQTIPHTSGAKSIARRRAELKHETGKKVSRVELWGITHKKKDGSYVNEQAKEIAEKIETQCTQQSVDSTIISPLDAVGVVLGKEHPGRVRGLSMGVVPTVAFKNNTTRMSQMNLGSLKDVGTSSTCDSSVQEEMDTVKAQLQALVSYIASKEGGKLPEHLATMFPNQQATRELDQGSEIPSPRELGSRSSGASNKEA
ncbi:hypothetical protein PIB30_055558 [Stylosanthes scabra]|uniref:Transposase, Ptta/En/Spm, plant n=1 Tax=Stylosanthes scabra TaxID=79078 RepID=A0ABU6XJD9_9FABA|nr:hypothetical protein [Stylosanthes scabra]